MAGSLHVSYGSSASILRRPRVVRSTPNIHREADTTDRRLGAKRGQSAAQQKYQLIRSARPRC